MQTGSAALKPGEAEAASSHLLEAAGEADSPRQPLQGLILRFTLPCSSYATMALREALGVDTSFRSHYSGDSALLYRLFIYYLSIYLLLNSNKRYIYPSITIQVTQRCFMFGLDSVGNDMSNDNDEPGMSMTFCPSSCIHIYICGNMYVPTYTIIRVPCHMDNPCSHMDYGTLSRDAQPSNASCCEMTLVRGAGSPKSCAPRHAAGGRRGCAAVPLLVIGHLPRGRRGGVI